MSSIIDNLKNSSNGKQYQYISDSISKITAPATFSYIGNFDSFVELYNLPKYLKKNFNVATITGIDGCFYYLNHRWTKFESVNPDDARITGMKELYRCIRSMYEFTYRDWCRFTELTGEYNIKPKPTDLLGGTTEKSNEIIVAELIHYTDPITLYEAYMHYTNKIAEEQINNVKSKRLDEIGNMMISFDISEDDIHEWIKHFNNEDAPDEAIEEDQKDEDRFKWDQSADCTKCRQRYACVPREDIQNLVKVHGSCQGFIPDKSRQYYKEES